MIFYIKLNPEQLANAYRRVVEREVRKVLEHSEALIDIVRTAPKELIGLTLDHQFAIEAVNISTSWTAYVHMYQQALASEQRQPNVCIASQRRILRRLIRIRDE